MHFAFLTVPSSGEFNVQLATAQELLNEGHHVTLLSGDSFTKHFTRFQAQQNDVKRSLQVSFVNLGHFQSATDFTPTVRTKLGQMRRKPGDIRSLQACIDIGHPSWEDHYATACKVRYEVDRLDADMVIVDALSPAMVNGVRMTKRPFYLTIPCSPGLTASSSVHSPHSAARHRRGPLSTIESLYLKARDLCYCTVQKPVYWQKSRKVQIVMGLSSFGLRRNVALLPPYWKDENCLGGIHFNPAGLNDCPNQPPNVFFVGAGISVVHNKDDKHRSETELWLDDALSTNKQVIFINLGSMFNWNDKEFGQMLSALTAVYNTLHGAVRFLFKCNCTSKIVPEFIKLSSWIEDQTAVYQHPAVKAFLHHGGGNSFNEAVFFGLPQIVLSQWLDTHEYGFLVERFGLGVHCKHAPSIRKEAVCEAVFAVLQPDAWQRMKQASVHWSIRSRLGGGPASAARLLTMRSRPKPVLLHDEKFDSSCHTSITCASP